MRIGWTSLACGLMLLVSLPVGANATGKLLPTASLAKQVRSLNMLISDSPPGTTMESRRRAGFVVRDRISQFIVDQIEAKSDITKDQLTMQLRAILCSNQYSMCDISQQPAVLSTGWFGPNGKGQFALAYQLNLGFMGPKGAITVVESYWVEYAKTVKHWARGGSEFDAYTANFQMVEQFIDPAEIWVLAWGQILGGNGRGIGGRATLYRVGSDAVTVAWDDAKEDNLAAQKSLIGWEVSYADHDLLYGNDPKPYFFDVYKLRYRDRTFSRVVHFQHADD
jgi:hypothetical protein